MSLSGFPGTPSVVPGALVQIIDDVILPIPNIIAFQYNPETMTRTWEVWNPFEVDQASRGVQAPTVQPYAPQEKFSFSLELSAVDDMEDSFPPAVATGVAPQIAALQKLTQPTEGLLGDLVASAKALAGNSAASVERPTVPIVLLILGPGIIYPIRVTAMSVEIKEFTQFLYPHMATVQIEMIVLTPDVFKCSQTAATEIAVGTYNFTKLQEDILAVANIATSAKTIAGALPF
ncbi:MAG: hypothetical protein AAGA53_16545 [Pseudomonadota bacterium]